MNLNTGNEPNHWTAETPSLYRIVVSLIDENGNAVDVEAYHVGFRNIEMKNGQLLVNGKAVLIREQKGMQSMKMTCLKTLSC